MSDQAITERDNKIADLKRQLAAERESGKLTQALLDDTRRANNSLREEIAALKHSVISAAYQPRPMCRDCADRDGTCHDGSPCDPLADALLRIRKWAAA